MARPASNFETGALKPLSRRGVGTEIGIQRLAPAGIERDVGSIRGPVSPQRASFLGKGWDRPGRQRAHFETAPFSEATADHIVIRALHAGSFLVA
jgi:hypothetical protein